MPVQTVYQVEPPIGVDGQRIENYPSAIASAIAEAAALPAGKIVVWDTDPGRTERAVRLPTAAADMSIDTKIAGFTLWDPTYPEPPYPVGQVVPIMRKGRIAIAAETALAAHSIPFVRYAAGAGGTVLGSLRNDADTTTAFSLPGLVVVHAAAAAGDIAVVEIDL
jgi:hypothetical protein